MAIRMFRALYRFLGMIVIISGHLIPIFWGRIVFGKDIWWAVAQRQKIARHLVRFLNIRIEMTMPPPPGNYLYVCNHRSYVDPVCIAVWVPFVPIAKAEVGSWPLIGWGAKITGIFYVRRENADSRSSTREAVRQVLQAGGSVLVFPEGTTAASGKTLPFRVGTFKMAAEAHTPVVPIAIEYLDPNDVWVGKDHFVTHFFRVFSKKTMFIRLRFFDPIVGNDATVLMQKAQQIIDNQLDAWRVGVEIT